MEIFWSIILLSYLIMIIGLCSSVKDMSQKMDDTSLMGTRIFMLVIFLFSPIIIYIVLPIALISDKLNK